LSEKISKQSPGKIMALGKCQTGKYSFKKNFPGLQNFYIVPK